MKLIVVAAVVVSISGCASAPAPRTHACSVDLTLVSEVDAARYCAAISDDPRSGACAVRERASGQVRCAVVAPTPVSLDSRTSLYYLGAAVYRCCR